MSSHNHLVPGDGPFTSDQLLVDAERTARQLLNRTGTTQGTSLLAGWELVLAAAAKVLAAHTHATPLEAGAEATGSGNQAVPQAIQLVDQLAEESRALEVARVPSRLHPDIVRLAYTWQQAAALPQRDPNQYRTRPTEEVVALRIVRTLGSVAHATQLALGGTGPGVASLGRDESQGFRRLLQRHEQLALRSVRAIPARAGEPAATTADAEPEGPMHSPIDRLSSSLKQWGPLAIVAAADPRSSAQDLHRIAMTEAFITAGAGALVAAAGRQQELPAEAIPHLQQRLEVATQHWKDVAGQWQWIRRYGSPKAAERLHQMSHQLAVAVTGAHAVTRPGPPSGPPTATALAIQALHPMPSSALLPVLQQITENSAILAEIFARLPSRTHRRDITERLRPVLYAPERVLQQIAKETFARDRAHLGPGAQGSPAVLDTPIASRQGEHLRPLTPDTVDYLSRSGAYLARAASAAEQALELAAGVAPRSSARRPTTYDNPTHHQAPPHMPGHHRPGPSPDTGMPR